MKFYASQIELINKQTAIQRYEETRELAFAIAKANDTLPGYCNARECKENVAYASLTQLKEGEQCLFIDGLPAEMLTDFEIERGEKVVIGKICGENMVKAEIKNDTLFIHYVDGVIEVYTYLNNHECWRYDSNNAGNIKLAQRGMN